MRFGKIAFVVLLVTLVAGTACLIAKDKSKKTKAVLSETSVISESDPETLIPTSTPTPTPTTPPTPIPTMTPTPTPEVTSEQINALIEKYAARYSVDPHVLRHIAICESTFNPLAKKLDYAGLYQFNQTCWSINRRAMNLDDNPDLRFDAEEAVLTAAFAISTNQTDIWPFCYPN